MNIRTIIASCLKEETPIYQFQKYIRAWSYSTRWMPYLRSFTNNKVLYGMIFALSVPVGFVKYLMNFIKPPEKGACTGLAIVAIIKNEGRYLKEWMDFYLVMGAEKIILFDNESTDNTAEIAKHTVYADKVDYIYFPGKVRQLDAYNIALRKYKKAYKYLAFLDCDEFMYCEGEKLNSRIERLFKRHQKEHMGGLVVNWLCFGSSGHIKIPQGGVLENYLWRTPDNASENHMIKSVVMPSKVVAFVSPHYPIYRQGYMGMNEKGEKVKASRTNSVSTSLIRNNHYFTKSLEDFEAKVARGRADMKRKRQMTQFNQDGRNEVFDDRILRVLAEETKHANSERSSKRN